MYGYQRNPRQASIETWLRTFSFGVLFVEYLQRKDSHFLTYNIYIRVNKKLFVWQHSWLCASCVSHASSVFFHSKRNKVAGTCTKLTAVKKGSFMSSRRAARKRYCEWSSACWLFATEGRHCDRRSWVRRIDFHAAPSSRPRKTKIRHFPSIRSSRLSNFVGVSDTF